MERLVSICEKYLAQNLTAEKAEELAAQGELCGSPLFKEATINFILQHWNEMKASNWFTLIKEQKYLLVNIVSQPSLCPANIFDEFDTSGDSEDSEDADDFK